MNIENILAREHPHNFVIFKYLVRTGLAIQPAYLYKTELARQSFFETFKFLQTKGLRVRIVQNQVDELLFSDQFQCFLSLLKTSALDVLCMVSRNNDGSIRVESGYGLIDNFSAEQAVSRLKPIHISFDAGTEWLESGLYADWYTQFTLETDNYAQQHVFTIEHALPAHLCDAIVAYTAENLQRSKILNGQRQVVESAKRTSFDAYIEESQLAAEVHQAALRLLGQSHDYQLEKPLVISYEAGQQFNPHFDTTDDDYVRRRRTVIFYLNDEFTGGETDFIVLGKRVTPQKGMALIFDNIVAGQTALQSMHAGAPVHSGRKYLCNVWTN